MKLSPITSTPEPTYPSYPSLPTWKRLAAVVAASAALWLPACGDDTTRLSGEPPVPEITQLPGAERVVQPPQPEVKPPEPYQPPVVVEPRLAGARAVPQPPPPPVEPPVRFAGQARAPEPPKGSDR